MKAKSKNWSKLLISEVWPYLLLAIMIHFAYNYFITSQVFPLIIASLYIDVIVLVTVHYLLVKNHYFKGLWRAK